MEHVRRWSSEIQCRVRSTPNRFAGMLACRVLAKVVNSSSFTSEELPMQLQGHDIAVCSWSLHPKGMADLVAKVKELGLKHVQLALVDLVMLDDKRKHQELGHLRAAGIGYRAA